MITIPTPDVYTHPVEVSNPPELRSEIDGESDSQGTALPKEGNQA